MDKSARKFPKFGGRIPLTWRELFASRHPVKAAAHVSAAIGAPERTVQNWIDGAAEPSLRWFAKILRVYGLDALAVIAPERAGWLAEAQRAAKQSDIESRIAALRAELDGLGRGA